MIQMKLKAKKSKRLPKKNDSDSRKPTSKKSLKKVLDFAHFAHLNIID